jgi:hypothetical protein
MLVASSDAKVKRLFTSSSTYGDSVGLPKVEDVIGKPLSPITKYVNELYADILVGPMGLKLLDYVILMFLDASKILKERMQPSFQSLLCN